MKTSVNNNRFFEAGKTYRCTRDVFMNGKGHEKAFTAGNIYEQVSEATEFFGWLYNDKHDRHCWPQPANIAHEAKIWGSRPEDIDPRLYFEPVDE